MDEQEARRVLGIEPGSAEGSWARAYLKAVAGPRTTPVAQLREAYQALRRAAVARGGPLTASAVGFDRFLLHGPPSLALPVLRRVARRVGVVEWADDTGSDLLLVVAGAAGPVDVRATGQDESTAVRVVVPRPPGADAVGLVASDVVRRLVLDVNERARQPAADEQEADELVVGIFVETDDEDVFRDVAKHVEELAAFLGEGQSIHVG